MAEKYIHIIKCGETFPGVQDTLGRFEDWIEKGLGGPAPDIRVVNAEQMEPLPEPSVIKGAVIAGSHAMVTDNLAWSMKLEAWVPGLVREDIPLLGICYGHQLMARALGGRVDYHPMGLEIGTKEISCSSDGDPLFSGFLGQFKAHVTHSQTVVQLPPSAVILAQNNFEPHHALRMGKVAWGVQFHPEYTPSIMKAYLEQLSGAVKESGQDLSGLMDGIEETPESALILARFASLSRQ